MTAAAAAAGYDSHSMQIVIVVLPTVIVKQVPPPVWIGTRGLGPLSVGWRLSNTVVTGRPHSPSRHEH